MADWCSGAQTKNVCIRVNYINKIGITRVQTSKFLDPFVATRSRFKSSDSWKAAEAKRISGTTGHMSPQTVTDNLNEVYVRGIDNNRRTLRQFTWNNDDDVPWDIKKSKKFAT